MKKLIFITCIILCTALTYAQRIPISVNLPTGTANVVIPVDNITTGNISVPVSLIYSSNGVKLKEGGGSAGLGWNLVAGGQVSRVVRGLPDDYDTPYDDKKGWLYSDYGTKVNNFTIANITNPPNCTDETTDINYRNTNFSNFGDTEPDLFSINAPGLSCQFVFDKDHDIKLLEYQDLVITHTTDGANIVSFTVTNDKGTKYRFLNTTRTSRRSTTQWSPGVPYWPEADIKYFWAEYYQYLQGPQYNDSWLLTDITDANGNIVGFNYEDVGTSSNQDIIAVNVGNTGLDSLYAIGTSREVKVLTSIYGGGRIVTFTYGTINNNINQETLISTITAKGIKYILNYADIFFQKGTTSFNFNCLRYITTEQCSSPISYYFDYESEVSGYPVGYDNRDFAFQYTDPWGYFTGTYSSGIGPVNPLMVNTGMLKQIKYFDGGTTTLEYESNDFYDPTTTSVAYGGGVRIKKITDYDGISTLNNTIRNYSYTDALGVTSGVPLSLPQYTFLKPVSTSPTTMNSTVSVNFDLSENSHIIMYKRVKESQTNKGYTVYEYDVPAGAFASSAPLGDWNPTMSHVAVPTPGCTPSLGLLNNAARTYPFAPNANYDFDQGLLKKETSFNDSDVKVAESEYTYTRTFTPVKIYGFRFDNNDYARSYSKYAINTVTGELVTQVAKTLFNPSPTTGLLSITKYVYGATAHKLLTQQEVTGSDGSVTRTNIAYSKEYTSTKASPYSTALVAKNINIPLETYTEVKPYGSSVFKVTGGQVTKFDAFPSKDALTPNTLPSTVHKFVSADGIIGFVPTLSTNAATPDSHYTLTGTFTNYNKVGLLKTTLGTDRRSQTALTDSLYQVPLAVFNNAASIEVGGYINGTQANSFTWSASNYTVVTSRSGTPGAYALTGSVTFSKVIQKNSWVKYYIFSAWLKSASPGSFNVTATATGGSTSATLNYAGGSIWKYYEIKVPVSSLANYLTISFTGSSGLIIGPDVLTYPETTNVSTVGYDINRNYKVIETNTNGISNYYENDVFGRLNLVYDNNKNITYRKTYNNFKNAYVTMPEPVFYIGTPVGDKEYYTGYGYTFVMYNNFNLCDLPTPTFTWDYGDGSAPTTSNSHVYTTPGSYKITVTLTATGIAPKTYSTYVTIVTPPPHTAYITYNNYTTDTGISRVELWQGTTLIQMIYPPDIASAKIVPGTYKVIIRSYGDNTNTSVVIDADNTDPRCQNWARVHTFNDVIINDILPITFNPAVCE